MHAWPTGLYTSTVAIMLHMVDKWKQCMAECNQFMQHGITEKPSRSLEPTSMDIFLPEGSVQIYKNPCKSLREVPELSVEHLRCSKGSQYQCNEYMNSLGFLS